MRDRVLMVVFVLVLGSILTGALVAVNQATTPVIRRNEELRLKRSILGALQIPAGESGQEVDRAFADGVAERMAGGRTFYISRATGEVAFRYTGPGLWGPINGALAVDESFRRIRGITIFHQEETPGLGSRIAEPQYLAQFRDKSFEGGLVLVPPGRSESDTQIDGITGATMTAAAFISLLNENLAAAAAAFAGGSP